MNQVLQKTTMNLGVVKKMIVSHMRYCITTWCNGNKTTLLKIQRIPNEFIRVIHGIYFKGSVKNTAQCV